MDEKAKSDRQLGLKLFKAVMTHSRSRGPYALFRSSSLSVKIILVHYVEVHVIQAASSISIAHRSLAQVEDDAVLSPSKSKFNMDAVFNESVAWTDIETLYRNHAQQGYDIVGWWGFQGAEAAAKVGKEYPSKQFFFTCVQENGNNTFSFVYEEEQAGFLSGILAGLTTKTNKVGVYAGTNMPCANAYANAFELGVHLTNPNATVLKAYVGSWTDPSKGKQTALTMINNGADFIAKYSNLADNGGMEACKENNISTTGIYLDQAFMAPNQTLVRILWQTDAAASQLITNAIAGQPPIGAQMPVGFENGGFSVKYDPAYNNLSQKARTTFESWVSKVQIGMYKVPRVETPIY